MKISFIKYEKDYQIPKLLGMNIEEIKEPLREFLSFIHSFAIIKIYDCNSGKCNTQHTSYCINYICFYRKSSNTA